MVNYDSCPICGCLLLRASPDVVCNQCLLPHIHWLWVRNLKEAAQGIVSSIDIDFDDNTGFLSIESNLIGRLREVLDQKGC